MSTTTDPWAVAGKTALFADTAAHCLNCGQSSLEAFPPDKSPAFGYICVHCTEQLTDEEAERLIEDNGAKEIKDHLSKPLVDRLQYDGWLNVEPGDFVMVPDGDGDVLMSTVTRERHRSGTAVRAWIDPTADPADVVRLLTKLTDWYRAEPPAADPLKEARLLVGEALGWAQAEQNGPLYGMLLDALSALKEAQS